MSTCRGRGGKGGGGEGRERSDCEGCEVIVKTVTGKKGNTFHKKGEKDECDSPF